MNDLMVKRSRWLELGKARSNPECWSNTISSRKFLSKNKKSFQIDDPWFVPVIPTGKEQFIWINHLLLVDKIQCTNSLPLLAFYKFLYLCKLSTISEGELADFVYLLKSINPLF